MVKKLVLTVLFLAFIAVSTASAAQQQMAQQETAQERLMRRRACDVILSWFAGPGDGCWDNWTDQCEAYYQGWLQNGCYAFAY